MTSYSVVSFDFFRLKKGELVEKSLVLDNDLWTMQGIGIVPDYEEVNQNNEQVRFAAHLRINSDTEELPVMVKLQEDAYMVEVTNYGGAMKYVMEGIGDDAFENDYQEIIKLVAGRLTGNAFRTTVLTLWGFDSSGGDGYFDDYDEWHWFEGIITNEMLAGLAKQIKGQDA